MPQALENDQIDLRLTAEAKEASETAAMISGQSLTDLVLDAVTSRAREVTRGSGAITLSARDHARVLATLDTPPEPSPALRRAAEQYTTTFE